jgi:hypothetical protein
MSRYAGDFSHEASSVTRADLPGRAHRARFGEPAICARRAPLRLEIRHAGTGLFMTASRRVWVYRATITVFAIFAGAGAGLLANASDAHGHARSSERAVAFTLWAVGFGIAFAGLAYQMRADRRGIGEGSPPSAGAGRDE